jgi:hypothetical protein
VEASPLSWYYFTRNGYAETGSLHEIPRVPHRPWTESVRISSASLVTGNALFLVNRLGMLVFTPDPVLSSDRLLFSDSTANTIAAINNNPVFHVYKDSFFNDRRTSGESPFLVQFRLDSREFFPILNTGDLGIPEGSEAIDVRFNGNEWLCVFKISGKDFIDFLYIRLSIDESLVTFRQQERINSIKKSEISSGEYRRSIMPIPFDNAPQWLQNLLSPMPPDVSYQITCAYPVSRGASVFIHNAHQGPPQGEYVYEGNAVYGDIWVGALFPDGTFYFSGALSGRAVLKNGEPIVMRLPKLPAGFVYSSFVITAGILYAGWEEASFYETARSGFLKINLEEVLY